MHTNRARGVRAGKFHVSSPTFVYLSFGQSLISKGLLDKKTEGRVDIKDGQREGGEAHRKSGVRLSSESVRNEAQGAAEGGCMAQGSAVPNWNCKK